MRIMKEFLDDSVGTHEVLIEEFGIDSGCWKQGSSRRFAPVCLEGESLHIEDFLIATISDVDGS